MWVSSLRGEFRPTSVNIGAKINLFDEKHDTKCKKDDLLTENNNKMGEIFKTSLLNKYFVLFVS